MKRKILPILLLFALLLSFASCSERGGVIITLPVRAGKDSEGEPVRPFPADAVIAAETEAPIIPADFDRYDNAPQDWWDGGVWEGDEDLPYRRPSWPRYQQNIIGKYDADCIFMESTEKVITLTFDSGYYNGYTDKILDILLEKDVHATFFLVMDFVDEAPELVGRMIDEGHTVGNHTVGHAILPNLTIEKQIKELMNAHDRILEEYGYTMHVMRFPDGKYSERSLALMQALGYRSSFWSFAYRDYLTDNQPDPDEALRTMLDRLHPGAIYVLHDCSSTNTQVLGEFIDRARALGYSFTDGYPK